MIIWFILSYHLIVTHYMILLSFLFVWLVFYCCFGFGFWFFVSTPVLTKAIVFLITNSHGGTLKQALRGKKIKFFWNSTYIIWVGPNLHANCNYLSSKAKSNNFLSQKSRFQISEILGRLVKMSLRSFLKE